MIPHPNAGNDFQFRAIYSGPIVINRLPISRHTAIFTDPDTHVNIRYDQASEGSLTGNKDR